MPQQKRQHYVPQCHFRPFSVGNAGAAINLFNISRLQHVENASIKGQCAGDYFYGDDRVLEKWLKTQEDEYAAVLQKLLKEGNLTGEDLNRLVGFAFLQYSRTEMAIKRRQQLEIKQLSAIYDGKLVEKPHIDMSERAIMLNSMVAYMEMRDRIADLKGCIIRNEAQSDFITSDDPAILVNKFYAQRLQSSNFGIGSSGVCFFMPLSPRFSVICYDGGVYTIPDKRGFEVTIAKNTDVLALNELQYLKAAENLYYFSWGDRDKLQSEFARFASRRPKSWYELSVWVPATETVTGTFYRPATDEEKRNAKLTLLTTSALYSIPSRWLSKLRYRTPPQTYSDGSAMGYVRKHIWVNYAGNPPATKSRPQRLPRRHSMFIRRRLPPPHE
jgi:hypothetical protein